MRPANAVFSGMGMHRKVFTRYKTRGVFFLLALCAMYVVSAFAGIEERLIHVFPVSVVGEGWEKENHALEQALGERATFDDFTRDNGAFVIVTEGDTGDRTTGVQQDLVDTPTPTQGEWGDAEVQDEAASEEGAEPVDAVAPVEEDTTTPIPDVSPSAYLFDTLRGFVGRTVRAEDEGTAVMFNQDVSVGEGVSDSDTEMVTESAPEAIDTVVSQEGDDTDSSDADTVDIEESRSFARSPEEDMRSCTVLGKECHTLLFERFDIGSVLSEHTIKGYTLRLSLAARTFGEPFTPDSIVVRYHYRGEWRIAGQVYIDRELSNANGGGHLSFPLPDLAAWDALQDFKVEVEFVRNSTVRTEVFLDSVWVDTLYEVASADEALPVADNIVEELAVLEDSARPDLLVADNKRIELTETEETLGEQLVLRSDADIYDGLTSARAYIAVTNSSDEDTSFSLVTHLGRQAEVVRVLERVEDVAQTHMTPSYSEVAYFCESGWKLGDGEETSATDAMASDVTVSQTAVESGETDESDEVARDEAFVPTGDAVPPVDDAQSEAMPNAEVAGQDTQDGVDVPNNDAGEVTSDTVVSNEGATSGTQESGDNTVSPQDSAAFDDAAYDAALSLSTTYTCKATGETEVCNSFNADKTNCIVGNERVSVDAALAYESAWQEVAISPLAAERAEGGSILARLFGGAPEVVVAPNLSNGYATDEEFALMANETRFFAIDLSFPVQRAGELLIEARSDEGDATRSVWWRSAFKYRMPLTLIPHGDVNEGDIPTLYEVSVDRTLADLFTHAALDGRDIRFFDAGTRTEIPVKEFRYTYVDQEAQYAVELSDGGSRGTTSLYAYFGNEQVDEAARLHAPALTASPIEYLGLAEPEEGAVVSVVSERDENSVTLSDDADVSPLSFGASRDVFIPHAAERLSARGPISLTPALSEYAAGVRTLSFVLPEDMHTTETRLADGRVSTLFERYRLASSTFVFGVLEELPIPAVSVYEPLARPDLFQGIAYMRELRDPRFHAFREALRDFELGDRPEFALQYRAQKGVVNRFFRGLFRERLAQVGEVHLLHGGVRVEDARFEVIYGTEGQWTIRMTEMPRAIQPGLYTLEISVDELGTVFTDSFDFYWGVLAINTPQSIYLPDDSIEFHMAALDDKGDTICNAELHLTVTDPEGNAEEVGVEPQGTCGANNVTDDPDYLAWYRPRTVGTYTLQLTHVNLNGEVVHRVSDAFEVRESVPFTIRRSGATRIWPKASYVMELELTATSDFTGQFVEAVPENFVLVHAGGAETSVWGGAKRLTWTVDLTAGETQTFSYEYDAPDVSPYLYLLGPAEVRSGSGLPFVEARQWKLASDALAVYTEMYQTFSAASDDTWGTVSLAGYGVPANAIVEVAITNSRNNRERYGGVRSTATSTLNRYLLLHESGVTGGLSTVTMHVQASATSSIQVYSDVAAEVTFTILGYWTSGTYVERLVNIDPNLGTTNDATWNNINLSGYGVGDADVVEMALANFAAGTDYDAGVRWYSSAPTLSRLVKIHQSANGGANFITMNVLASTSNATIQGYAQVEGAAAASVDYYLLGYWSTLPDELTYQERLDDFTGPTSATVWQDRALDGYGAYKNNIAEVLLAYSTNTSGSNVLGVHANGSAVGRTLDFAYSDGAGTGFNMGRMHVQADNTASATIEYYAESTTADEYRLLGYWKAFNLSPEMPTMYDVPFNNEKTGSSTPYLDFSATDLDGTSDLVYQVQYDDDADLDTSPLADRTSDNETGCSPNCFTNVTSGGDTSPFTEGNRIRFSVQTALTTGTTYYWRVRAKDTSGSNSFGEWSAVQSFTYVSGTDPKAWYQSEDAQFDDGTLISTETYGENKVRIATTPPVGAMVAYGEGAGTTPRYRTWSGTAWSSEGSAQDVGGRISWTVLESSPTRNEYVLGTQDVNSDVNVQVYNGTAGTWSTATELNPNQTSIDRRGFDIAYQSLSGNAVAVFCYNSGTNYEASYSVWNGTNWSATSTIDLQFNAPCSWIKLAASPSSDEIVMVAQADSANTTSDFEVQVYRDETTKWNITSYTGGANTLGEEMFERMAVEWEESGEEAVVALGNGGGQTPGIVGAVWNSAAETWTAYTSRNTQDDFEWGELVADDGTNNLGLCYIDEDAQVQIAYWNGATNAWDTYVAGTTQVDNDGKGSATYHARPISCQYETTTGRDGYLMIPYSDETNARYRVWTGSSFAATEQSITTIEDSWTAGSVRTGDGKILAVFRDDTNDRFDFSYWNGSGWSSRETLETSMPDDTSPYAEPIALAPQRYQASVGNIVSPIVDFDLVVGQSSWGEALWSATEPSNTSVEVQVLWAAAASSTCTAVVPNGVLPGNEDGFAATSSPLDLSGIATTTDYNRLCLKATLTSNTNESPTLDDWTISWERQPYLTQTHYKWFANTSGITPTDAYPSGAYNLIEDEAIGASHAPSSGEVLRLRLAIEDTNVTLAATTAMWSLQWAEGAQCSASLSWQQVGAIGSSEPWRGYNNAPADGTTLSTTTLSTTDVLLSYEEENNTATNTSAIADGEEAELDFVLQHNATSSTNYCFRLVNADGTTLNDYDRYPQLVTNAPPVAPTLATPFTYEALASSSPWFTFVAEDGKGDVLDYQIEVDDDYTFGSQEIESTSENDNSEFKNIISTNDLAPFNSGETVRFVPTTSLADGTYWWRVRAKDTNGSGEWGEWSLPWSFTASSSITISTWHQTTFEQFEQDDLESTEATSTNDIVLTPPLTEGTSTSPMIDFDWRTTGNAWGTLDWADAENAGDIKYHLEYYTEATGAWALIPDSALPDNVAGHDVTQPISLLSLDPSVYSKIRVRANFRDLGGAKPRLNSWTISWGLAVEQPTLDTLFDNEKVGTTTPSFTFYSTDPQGDNLQYEFQWSSTPDFAASTTRRSGVHAGFVNTASSTDTSQFVEGDTIQFTIQSADALTNGATYWWRVRAIDSDIGGGDAWSVYSPVRSFTVDTSVLVSTWYQTTDEQFDTALLNSTETYGSDEVRITSTIREAMTAYVEGNIQTPRYRIWNGQAWGTEKSAQNVSERIDWVRVDAAPTRNEYLMATEGASGKVVAQVYDGDTASWSDLVTMVPTVSNVAYRGYDITYESLSGRAMVVACSGQDAVYRTWDGTDWSGTSTINLTIAQNCEWIQLAADTDSNEIILMARFNNAGTADYEAQVWNGSGTWSNSTLVGNAGAATDEGMAVMYEDSGTDAVIVFSNGTNNNFASKRWNGSWQATTTTAIGNDHNKASMCRDLGTDRITVVYTDEDTDIGYAEWDGTTNAWGASTELEVDGVNEINNQVSCQYETTAGREGNVLFTYGDGVVTTEQYRVLDRTTPVTIAQNVSTLGEAYSAFTARTGDGNILGLYYDDDADDYFFSYWNGAQWSVAQQLESDGNTQAVRREPLHLVARRYTAYTSGSIVSDPVVFTDGTGPRWGIASSTDTTDDGYILYQIEYSNDAGETWALIPDEALPGNGVGTTSNRIDLTNVSYATYGTIRYVANFVCVSGDCPVLHDWTISWSEGITISGTIKQYDESTPVASGGDVRVAVNGVLQAGKIGTISGGTWSIANVTMFPSDVITVFIDGVGDSQEAAAVTRYDGFGNMTGVELFERHLTIGSQDATTTSNANIALYDYTSSGDEDLFFDVDTGNDLYVATSSAGYYDTKLYVASSSTYRPDSANSGTLYAHDVVIRGTTTADSNTFYVHGSWNNTGIFAAGNGTVVFTATSSLETIDSSGASEYAFNTLTFGQSGTATWTLASLLDVNKNLTVTYGTLSVSASDMIIGGNLSFALGTTFVKGTGTTTFDGATTPVTITDSTASKQDLGAVHVNGSSKSVALQSAVKLTDLTIATANSFDVSALNYPLEVRGYFRNYGSFGARAGTVTFTATSTSNPIYPGASSFWNLTANGVGGNWYFEQPTVTIGNTLTVATGTLTLALGTTTVSGNLTNTGGVLQHNGGTVELAGAGAKTIYQNGSPLQNITVSGTGSWSWTDTNATTSGTVRVGNGTLTLPSGTFAIGKSLINTGGTIAHNSGTLRFTSYIAETIRTNGSNLHTVLFDGAGGTFTLADTNLSASGTVRFVQGTTTLPSGTFTVGGSFLTTGGTWAHGNGAVFFNSSATGHTINPGQNAFNQVTFNNASGGWTVSSNATSTGAWTIANAASFTAGSGVTIEVLGTFTNSAPSATTWDGSALYLNSGTGYTVGTKTQNAEGYGTLRIGANTDIRMWQASSTGAVVEQTGSLYSQDHAAQDGDLYIYGTYERTSGADYWSHATDFDGTGIGGSPRQVDVRFASGAAARFSNATLHVVGGASASTTISNQGSGSYGLSVENGTVTAQYYSMTDMDTHGFSILGSSTVTSLSDGVYTLTAVGASSTMLTVSSTTIDANPMFQIQRVAFSTSTGITEGYNVTASGTASSYWWFRNHNGNYDGEDYDSDPVVGAGSLRWDDSGFTIDVSGTVYAGEGIGGAPATCNGSTQVLRLVVSGGATYDTHCDAGTGTFTFNDVTYSGDVSLVAFVFGTTTKAAVVSRSPQSDITGFDLYEHRVIVRHESVDALTIANMMPYDSDQHADVPFDAESGMLTVSPETSLHVWTGKTFAPGGNVTLQSGGSGAGYDGTLRLASGSTFTAVGSESHSIGGSFIADASATFTAAQSTVTLNATTTGKTVAPSSSFYNLTFSGADGAWTIASSTTVGNAMTVSDGTVSGAVNLNVQNGALSGDGTLAFSAGTVTVGKGGTFGGANDWTFNNLTLGDGTAYTTTKNGNGNVLVTGVLTVAATHVLDAGSVNWTLNGAGAVLSVAGTFTANTSTTTFAGTSAMTVPALAYHHLVLAPSGAGSPTYTLSGGTPSAATLSVGNGTNPVTVNVTASNPLLTVSGMVWIRANATYSAANTNDLLIGGSYVNQGTFTSNGGGVVFNATETGKTITPGLSSFHHLTLNGVGGGWTMLGSATTTGNFLLTSAAAYTQTSGTTLSVQGVFTNTVGGGATTWDGSTLYLQSGTAYPMNTKTAGGDVYGTLRVGANTDVNMWNSTSTVYTVDRTGSLYSQDHDGEDGALYIWGDYVRASGNEYWSYETDFDGTALGGSPRTVQVRLAPNATTTLTGGTWNIVGTSTMSTTSIATQGGGTYALRVTGGTFNAQYYKIRDISATGLEFSGSPTVSQLSDGDLELSIQGGTMLTVAGSVISANPIKRWDRISFATSTGIASGYNASTTGVSTSFWRFTPALGNYYGEMHDGDSAPDPDPGYLIWDDSNSQITISGNVYSNESGSVSSLCTGASVVTLVLDGVSPQTTSCAPGTGAYSFTNISMPVSVVTVYLDGVAGKAAHVLVDPVLTLTDMHLYENRVVVRHEDVNPVTIAHMATYDSSDDTDIPFDANDGVSDTLTVSANHKLIVWTGKTFTPGGDVTLNSGGTGTEYDGTLELRDNASYISSPTVAQAITIGGSWLTGTGATFTAGTSTVTFTATTSGKLVSPNSSAFNNLTFNGSGGVWTFTDRDATTTRHFTISAGNVTLGTSTLSVGGSFVNSATMSAASTSIRFSSAQAQTVAFGGYAVGSLTFAGAGAHTMTDTQATSTGSVSITAGSVALPSGTFAIANGFSAQGGTFSHSGTLRMYGTLTTQTLRFGASAARHLAIAGTGSWAFADTHATTTGTTTISSGGLTAPAGTFAVGGSFVNTGTFNSNAGLLYLYATTTGQTITASSSLFSNVVLRGVGGGWTVTGSATTSGMWRLQQGASFTLASSTMLEVGGVFENAFASTTTDWTNSTLYLNASGTAYTVNTRNTGGDTYAYLTLGANTDVRMWDSAAATTTVPSTGSLYSMDHGGTSGDLFIWGEYVRSTGSDYWSYATDFEGGAPIGGSRQVDVRIASSSSLSFTGGTLEIVGTESATTTIAVAGTGTYAFAKSGGTLNAQYYSFRNLNASGLVLTNALTVTSLSYGDFERAESGGYLLQVASTTIDQNPTKVIASVRFGTTTGVSGVANIKRNGTSTNANFWDFRNHMGEIDGEAYDDDGIDACGSIRWDDSTCLEFSQTHFRFRNDDGTDGAPDSEWYDSNWNKRKRVHVTNPNAGALTNTAVRFEVAYEVGDMQTSWNDLRFTDNSGTTSLPHFIESYTAATATVWVKIPSVSANDTGFIYLYYDNDFAANAESGSNTFTFFDDFEDDDLTGYTGNTTQFDAIAESGGEGAYTLHAASGQEENFTTGGLYQTTTTFGPGSTIRFLQYVDENYEDQPCTLFGVGGSGSNYAVCLTQYPSDRLVIAEDVTNRATAALTLASTTVTWTSGWYTVEVDWLSGGTLYASVYDSVGALFATTTASDLSHTSAGGSGFSFWTQHGAWDFYTARPYLANEPTVWVGLEQEKGGASWKAAQDTSVTVDQGQPFRVRFSIENSGPQEWGKEWRLQYADKTGYGTCNAVPSVNFDTVPGTSAACAGSDSPVCMTTTSGYVDQGQTQALLVPTTLLPFTAGRLIEADSNQTASTTLPQGYTTEVEYAVELTADAISNAYCMRVSDGDSELDSYQTLAEVTANYGPQINEWVFNGSTVMDPNPIVLMEGETTSIVATGTVSDLNGGETLLYATSTFYRTDVGPDCAANPNNCYQLNSLECPLTCAPSGTTCEVTCTADIQYFADPTDWGDYSAETWEARLFIMDDTLNEASSTSDGAEVGSMLAMSVVSGDIAYGALEMGASTTAQTNASSTIQNTGNIAVDLELEGTDLTSGASTIPVGNQKFSTSSFTYSACVICGALSGTASTLEVDLPKAMAAETPVTDVLYWGIYIPTTGVSGATHRGQTTFYAVGD